MVEYEILTENKNPDIIEAILNNLFTSYTIREQTGYYKGQKEKSLSIIVIGPYQDENILKACWDIKTVNNQETVLYTVKRLDESHFI
jgi:uncharacterized membrane-anchored protein YitT (DUF2179 family)